MQARVFLETWIWAPCPEPTETTGRMTTGGAPWPRPVSFGSEPAVSSILAELAARFARNPTQPGVDPADIARWSGNTGLSSPRLLDRLAAEIALGFHTGQLGFDVCDHAVNALQCTLYWVSPGEVTDWPDLFWQTYLAFDAGEYARQAKPDEDPVEVHTRPLITAIVERLLPDGGWFAMFHDASVHRFVIRSDGIQMETEEFACSRTETMPAGRIVIAGALCMHRNDEVVAAFEIESDDAEINGVDRLPDGVRVVLFWHFWKSKAPAICRAYWFQGATVCAETLAGGPLVPMWTPLPET